MADNLGAFRYRVDPNGMLYVERLGEYNGERQWYYHEGDIPDSMDMQGRVRTEPPVISDDFAVDNRRANEMMTQRLERERLGAMQQAIETWQRGEASVQRRNEAEEMPFMERATIHAGEFADSMMSGMGDFLDFLADDFHAGKNDPRFNSNAPTALEKAGSPTYARTNERRAEREESDRIMQELKDYSTGAEFAGELPTYLLTGAAGDIFKLGNTIRPGLMGKPFNKALDFDEIPLLPNRTLTNLPDDPYRKDLIEEILTLTGVSAAEGGINPDDTLLGGALGGGTGAATGRLLSGRMENRPDLNDPNTRRILDVAQKNGYNPSPGLNRADPGLLANEAGLRSRPDQASFFGMYDRANDQALMRMAANSIGLELPRNVTSITPQQLSDHIDSLRIRYEDLAGDTRGVMNPQVLATVRGKTNAYPETRAGEAAARDLNAHADRLDSLVSDPSQFTGATYQQFRRELMDDYSAAVNEGNSLLQTGLRDLVQGLDDGINTGMRQGLSGGDYVKWKDLNEQYAMSMTLKDYGLTPIGTLNSKGLSEHIQRTQQDSMLMTGGRGTPIDDFVNLAQLDYLSRHGLGDKARSGLSSTQVDTPDKISASDFFLQTPESGKVTPMERLRGRLYFDYGYPVETGLLGIPMDSSFRMAQLGRARGQGSDVDERASSAYTSVDEYFEKLRKGEIDVLDSLGQATGGAAFSLLNN